MIKYIKKLIRNRALKKEMKELSYLIKESKQSVEKLSCCKGDKISQVIKVHEADIKYWENRVKEIKTELNKETTDV